MATTSMSLGPYFEQFLKEKVASGRYASATEVVREALRDMDEREKKLAALRAHVAEGMADLAAGRVVHGFDLEAFMADGTARSGEELAKTAS